MKPPKRPIQALNDYSNSTKPSPVPEKILCLQIPETPCPMASLAPLVEDSVKSEPQIVDISSVESTELPSAQIVSLHEASSPASDYSATPYGHMISQRTQQDDDRRIRKLRNFFTSWTDETKSHVVLESDADMDSFMMNATIEDLDKFLSDYIRSGCLVKDRNTGEDKLPTAPSFATTMSVFKRIVNLKFMRNIGKPK